MKERESWKSKLGFTFAAAGSAVGLANIWRFPYLAGQNGGAAFIIIYIICLFAIGFPVFLSEIILGRKEHRNPYGAYKHVSKNHPFWKTVGFSTILVGLLVSSFYSVIAGWILGYFFEAVGNNFATLSTPELAENLFSSHVASPIWTVGMHLLFTLFCSFILLSGVRKGIERGSKIMMPLLTFLLLFLCIQGLFSSGANQALSFLFIPDWSQITTTSILLALGQAAFTLSLGQGTMITYGSYLRKKDNILFCAAPVVLLDTLISLLAGVAIFTIVFTVGLSPSSGPGLLFKTLPVAISQLPSQYLFGIGFFLLITLAAVTSEISAMEPLIAYLVDEKKWKRKSAVICCAILTFCIGIPSALSTNLFKSMTLGGLTFFDAITFFVLNICLPVSGLLVIIFVAWKWGIHEAIKELKKGAEKTLNKHPWFRIYLTISLKYIAPILILMVLLDAVGFFTLF